MQEENSFDANQPFSEISKYWEQYPAQQKQAILAQFQNKYPKDYYCKVTLFKFLEEKFKRVKK